jgi:hypothetical protein
MPGSAAIPIAAANVFAVLRMNARRLAWPSVNLFILSVSFQLEICALLAA